MSSSKQFRSRTSKTIAMMAVLLAVGASAYVVWHPRRPQDEAVARGPRPYSNHEVAFTSDGGRIRLAGTLSLPNGKGPFPAVALITAAGPVGRDENAAGHLVFVVLADHLLRQGIAVLRYDKRGVGKSTGDFASATFSDLVSDAHTAFRYLASRPEVDAHRVGMIGHSEGGSIAPAVAAMDREVAFVVAMAGSGLSGEFRFTEHEVYLAQQDGASQEQQSAIRALCRNIFREVAGTPDNAVASRRIGTLIDAAVKAGLIRPGQEREIRGLMTAKTVREELTDFPLEYLKKVTVPVLALIGTLDHTVPAGPYERVMRPVLAQIPGSQLAVLPNLNHVMQTAKTGSFDEFGKIEETISPLALRVIGDFVCRQAAKQPDAPPETAGGPRQ